MLSDNLALLSLGPSVPGIGGGAPKLSLPYLLRGPKLGALQRRSVERRHILRHVKRLLRCAQGQLMLGAGLHSHRSGLLTHGSG